MSVKVTTNFSDIGKSLDDVANKIRKESERLSGKVSFATLFNENFMSKYTNFNSLEELLIAGGYGVTQEEFKAIPEDEFDKYITNCTQFSSWEEMQHKAVEEYTEDNFKL